MKTNLYFSFIGSCYGKELSNLENLSPEVVENRGSLLYSNSPSTDIVEIYEVKGTKDLVYVVKISYNEPRDWYFGDEYAYSSGGDYDYRWYLCRRDSFDCLPKVPVSSFGEAVQQALA